MGGIRRRRARSHAAEAEQRAPWSRAKAVLGLSATLAALGLLLALMSGMHLGMSGGRVAIGGGPETAFNVIWCLPVALAAGLTGHLAAHRQRLKLTLACLVLSGGAWSAFFISIAGWSSWPVVLILVAATGVACWGLIRGPVEGSAGRLTGVEGALIVWTILGLCVALPYGRLALDAAVGRSSFLALPFVGDPVASNPWMRAMVVGLSGAACALAIAGQWRSIRPEHRVRARRMALWAIPVGVVAAGLVAPEDRGVSEHAWLILVALWLNAPVEEHDEEDHDMEPRRT